MTQPVWPYKLGDTVHFRNASLVEQRFRDYEVTALHPDGLGVSAQGHFYFLTRHQAEELGITKASGEGS
ncbi:hypothetical protein ABZW50_29290 [Streptomyces bacillaris]